MPRYKVVVSYLGKNYVGWQTQANGLSVQAVIEECLSNICNEEIHIVASGRTDAGVNSVGQTFHFDTQKGMDVRKFEWAVNGHLPKDIFVRSIEEVSTLFHARYSVLSKTYVYKINLGEYNVFTKDYIYNCRYSLDIDKMIEASKIFIGYHDFTSFCSNNILKFPNQKREIFKIDFEKENEVLKISFKGKGFLRYMVRMLMASLIEVGRGKLTKDDLQNILDLKSKDVLNKNAAPCGLTLQEVDYFRIVYLDEEIMIRSLHKEDKRILNLDIKSFENLYGILKRNDETVLGILYFENDNLLNYSGEYNLEDNIRNSAKKHIKSSLF